MVLKLQGRCGRETVQFDTLGFGPRQLGKNVMSWKDHLKNAAFALALAGFSAPPADATIY